MAALAVAATVSLSTVPQPPTQPVVAAGRHFSIIASGDVLIHDAVWERARENGRATGREFDFRPMFAPVKPVVGRADFAICHMEVPLSRNNRNLSTYPVFNAPRQVAPGVRSAGYDSCSTASNHSMDQGEQGIYSTMDVLEASNLEHEGTARSRRGGRRAAIYRVDGVKVGHVSFTYGLNGFTIPDDKWWLVNVIDAERIVKQAQNARERGAEFVLVSLHWGEEYQTAPTDFQRDLARRILRSPAIDAVVGHHAHVVQPVTTGRERFVVYGLGNHVSAQYSPVNTQDGLIVKLLVEERDAGFVVAGVRVTPTYVERGSYRILPVARTLRAKWPSESLRATLRASWDRTMSAVRSMGRDPRVKPSSYPPR